MPIQVHRPLLLQRPDAHDAQAGNRVSVRSCKCIFALLLSKNERECQRNRVQQLQAQVTLAVPLQPYRMDKLDTMAPRVDLKDQQELAEVIQSSSFVSILACLAVALLALGRVW